MAQTSSSNLASTVDTLGTQLDSAGQIFAPPVKKQAEDLARKLHSKNYEISMEDTKKFNELQNAFTAILDEAKTSGIDPMTGEGTANDAVQMIAEIQHKMKNFQGTLETFQTKVNQMPDESKKNSKRAQDELSAATPTDAQSLVNDVTKQ